MGMREGMKPTKRSVFWSARIGDNVYYACRLSLSVVNGRWWIMSLAGRLGVVRPHLVTWPLVSIRGFDVGTAYNLSSFLLMAGKPCS